MDADHINLKTTSGAINQPSGTINQPSVDSLQNQPSIDSLQTLLNGSATKQSRKPFVIRSKNNVSVACESCKRRRRKCQISSQSFTEKNPVATPASTSHESASTSVETAFTATATSDTPTTTSDTAIQCDYCLLKGLTCIFIKGNKRGPKTAAKFSGLTSGGGDAVLSNTLTSTSTTSTIAITEPVANDSTAKTSNDKSIGLLVNSHERDKPPLLPSTTLASIHNTSSSRSQLSNSLIIEISANGNGEKQNIPSPSSSYTRLESPLSYTPPLSATFSNNDPPFEHAQNNPITTFSATHELISPISLTTNTDSAQFSSSSSSNDIQRSHSNFNQPHLPLLSFLDLINGPFVDFDLAYGRSQDPASWTCLTFFCIQMMRSDGVVVSFLDYYFLHVHLTLPWFEQAWLECHLGDLPLHLLHMMYAFCLTCQTPWQVSLNAQRHYYHAFKTVHQDLEKSDPFTVATLVHMAHFTKFMRQGCTGFHHLSLAINLAIQLCIYDSSCSWISPIGNFIMMPSFTLGMWFSLYSLDFTGTHLFGMPLMIQAHVTQEMIDSYRPPDNSLFPCGQLETNLSFIVLQLPLITLARDFMLQLQYKTTLNLSKQYEHLLILDAWFATLPLEYRYPATCRTWKGRGIAWMNGLYYAMRLRLLRDKFISTVSQIQSGRIMYDPTMLLIIQCTACVDHLTNIAACFSAANLSGFQSESTFLQNCIYYAGLYNCAFLYCHGEIERSERDAKICLDAMKKSYGGRDVGVLEWCAFNGYKGAKRAFDVIRNDNCWLTLHKVDIL